MRIGVVGQKPHLAVLEARARGDSISLRDCASVRTIDGLQSSPRLPSATFIQDPCFFRTMPRGERHRRARERSRSHRGPGAEVEGPAGHLVGRVRPRRRAGLRALRSARRSRTRSRGPRSGAGRPRVSPLAPAAGKGSSG